MWRNNWNWMASTGQMLKSSIAETPSIFWGWLLVMKDNEPELAIFYNQAIFNCRTKTPTQPQIFDLQPILPSRCAGAMEVQILLEWSEVHAIWERTCLTLSGWSRVRLYRLESRDRKKSIKWYLMILSLAHRLVTGPMFIREFSASNCWEQIQAPTIKH